MAKITYKITIQGENLPDTNGELQEKTYIVDNYNRHEWGLTLIDGDGQRDIHESNIAFTNIERNGGGL